jgi:hypothetical protein
MRAIPLRKVAVVFLNVFFTAIFIDIEMSVAQVSGPDIVSGLQAYWKFDEGSDTTGKDMSGNHVNGTLHSNAGWTSQGKFNNALSIDNGTNGYVDFGTSNLQLTSELTISLWVYRQGNSGSYSEALISRCQYGYPFLIQLQNSGYVSTFLRGSETSGGSYVVSSAHLQNGTWNHIVLTYKYRERIIYINGALDKTDTVVKGNLYSNSGGSPANIRIGASGAGSNPMWGNYDEVRIYNRVLSAEEIKALYDGTGLDSTASKNTLSANWTATSDPQSKIVRYYYAIGKTPGGKDVLDWTNNQLNLSFIQRGLDLTVGTTYYTTIEAENSSGLKSTPVSSNGIHVVNIQYSNLVAQDSGYRRNNPIDVVNYPQNLPPLSEIVNKPLWDVPSSGLFTWRDTWSDWTGTNNSYTNEIHQIGWKSIRAGGYYYEMLKDQEMVNLAKAARNDNIKSMWTLMGKQRYQTGEFTSDQQWIDSYLVFIDSMIYRFGPRGTFFHENPTVPYEPILYWEVWNEPDLYYMLGQNHSNDLTDEQKADLYARLLIASYNHIRSKPEWNDVKVIAMSAAGVNNEIPDWIDLVHAAVKSHNGNPANCYDILSIHPYTHDCPSDIEDIMTSNGVSINYTYSLINETAKTREVMAKWGNANKPVWFTEVGWSRYNGPNLNGRPFPVTERQQAAYVCRLYAITMRLGVDQLHVMFVIDGNGYLKPQYSWDPSHGTVNYQTGRIEGSFYHTCDAGSDKVHVGYMPANQHRQITMSGNSFHDTFSLAAVHIYKISKKGESSITAHSVPIRFSLYQNYPNPFNPSTKIDFMVATKENIKLVIYDLLGRQIRTLVDGIVASGTQSVFWDGRDTQGKTVSSGVYFYSIDHKGQRIAKQMVLIK